LGTEGYSKSVKVAALRVGILFYLLTYIIIRFPTGPNFPVPNRSHFSTFSTKSTAFKMSSSISSFFSSFLPVIHADSEEKPEQATETKQEEAEPAAEEEAEEEEEEPEDVRIVPLECSQTN
jgi:hypothetical protein